MPSISSLLKSAEATRKKIRTLEDQYAAFEWENSAQTADDFNSYQKYLEERAGKTTDPSDQLTYQGKIRAARRSFVSNEIQRGQMAIMEGRAGTQDKMNLIQELYYQAVDNQDFNLAQNLISQWDGLSIKLQNEQEAAAKAFASSSKKAKDTLIKDLTKGVDDITLPDGSKVTPLAQIARDLEQNRGESDVVWKAASDTLEAIRNAVIDQYNTAKTQEEVDALEDKYGAGLVDLDKEVFFQVGGKKLNLQEVINAEANESMNNPQYSLKATRNEATGKNEFQLVENKVERLDYVRQFDEQGNEFFVPASVRTSQSASFFGGSDRSRSLDTQITDEGAVVGGLKDGKGMTKLGTEEVYGDDANTIRQRLKRLGIEASGSGQELVIKLPGDGVQRQAIIQPDGSIRYYGDDGNLVEIGLVDRNLGSDAAPQVFRAGEQRVVSAEEVSDFSRESAFGGTLSRASAQGERYIKDILGRSPVERTTAGPLAGPIRTGNDFSGFGTAVTSNLLQSASQTRNAIAQEQARQAMLQAQNEAAARLQASQTFNLNQTPVRQMTSNGLLVRQLQVAAPTPQPRVTVAAPRAPQRITNVGVTNPANRVSGVGVSGGSTRRVTVR